MTSFDDAVQEAIELSESASARDPRQAKFGIVTEDRSTGLSMHVALWFETLEQVAEFLMRAVPYLYSGEGEAIEDEVRPLVESIVKDGLTEGIIDEINAYTHDWEDLVWGGTFDELCRAETQVTTSIVAMFREARDLDETGPIAESEVDEFVDFLAELPSM